MAFLVRPLAKPSTGAQIGLCILLIGVFLATACNPNRPDKVATNIVLVVIDTLRADRLGCYGNKRGLTPFMDSLAERGYVFKNAYAQSSWTKPSVASLLTSRYPSQHRVIVWGSVLPEAELTLPEMLRDRGYATAAFQANILLPLAHGFGQGFDEYRIYPPKLDKASGGLSFHEHAARLNRESLAWLSARARTAKPDAPVFLYLQYMEPHNPWRPPERILERVLHGRPRPDITQVNASYFVGRKYPIPSEMWADIRDLYDAEVMTIDSALRELFLALGRTGFLDNSIVVITADHGEELNDHGAVSHGTTLYNEVIHVPLIIVPPWQQRRTEVDAVVSLIDVAPTLLDLIGASPPASFEGRSLKESMLRLGNAGKRVDTEWGPSNKRSANARAAYSELVKPDPADAQQLRFHYLPIHEGAVVMGSRKLIVGVDGRREFYSLDADAHEMNPRGLSQSEQESIEQVFARAVQRAKTSPTAREVRTLDPEMRERLHALGYAD